MGLGQNKFTCYVAKEFFLNGRVCLQGKFLLMAIDTDGSHYLLGHGTRDL